MKPEILYKNIRALRINKGLSQENAANDLGLSLTGYANIETGKTNLSYKRLCQLAKYYNVTVQRLLSDAESLETKKPTETVNDKQEPYLTKKLSELQKEIDYLKILVKEKDKIIRLLEKR